jgi:cytochrome P450
VSEAATAPSRPTSAEYRTPEQEQAEKGRDVAPAHELPLEDINPLNANLFRENRWQGYFERLRREDPVHFNEIESAGRYWSVTKYDDIKTVSANWQTFSSAKGITLGFRVGAGAPNMMQLGTRPPFISQDPPGQTEQRKTVRPSVAPRNLAKLEPLIRERTCRVLDSLPEGETFDWVDTVSIELTTAMLATLFDFPFEDRRKLTRWSDIVFAIPQPGGVVESMMQKREELMGCLEYFSRLWEERRKQPGGDLISMLAHGEATRDMSAAEHLGNVLLLIVGGNDTTRNTMSGSVYSLNQFPEQYDKLVADPGLIRNMVSEVIRWQTPLSYMRRTATRDCELAGKQIRKDDQLLMWYVSGNRDEDVFENANALDIERSNAVRHLSFGFGIHFCMGSRLAEMQLRVLWEEILERFERIEVQAEPERTLSSFVKGYTYLPVKITRKDAGAPRLASAR